MKNEVLNSLTEKAATACADLPNLLLHGDGSIVDSLLQPVENAKVVQSFYKASQALREIHEVLAETPRRTVRQGRGDEE